MIQKVLLVDDEADIRKIASLSLRRTSGWEVVQAESGEEALDAATQSLPDVILLDVMMPRMDGKATLARLREQPRLAQVPVIFMTAKVQKHEISDYLRLGAVGVIEKPFDPMQLAAKVNAILERPKEPS